MNFLHVISSMDPRSGGPCQGIRNLTPGMLAQGHTVEVVCLDDSDSDYLAKESLCIHALGKGRGAWSYHPALRPWLDENLPRFDAVILNGLWQYPGYALSQASQRAQMPPYFVFPHGMLDPWFQSAPGRRLKAIRNWFYWKLIEQRVVRHAAALLFTCAEELRLARETFRPYQPKREINVGFGVPQPPQYHRGMETAFAQKCPGVNDRPYFLFLGRIHPKKGVDLLIRAYFAVYGKTAVSGQRSAVSSDLRPPTSDLRFQTSGLESPVSSLQSPPSDHSTLDTRHSTPPLLVIAGPGLETPYGQQMQKLASDLCPPASKSPPSPLWGEGRGEVPPANSQLSTLNPQPAILFPGMLTGDAKLGALYNADAFVLTSHQENFGIAVVESLACGRPVLISNQINIWREIEEDKAGLAEADTLAGAEQLFRRWENLSPEAKAGMKKSARASYENRFDIALAGQHVLAIIEDLTRHTRAPEKLNGNGGNIP